MTTARDVITLALKEAGVLGVGQTALPEDMNDSFTLLKNMINQWQKRRWLVPALEDISHQLDGSRSYTIGATEDCDIKVSQRPNQIKAAYVVQLYTGQTPISLPLRWITSYEDYARITVKNLTSLPDHFFYDGRWPKGNIFFWPIGSSVYEAHIIVERILAFTGIDTGSITNAGAAYTDSVYNDVDLTGGNGTGATANITIVGNVVTNVQLVSPGQDYVVGNQLSVAAADVGGTGAGFIWTIDTLNSNIDYEFELPEEYMEAIHYNLAVRLISMYQVPDPSPQTGVLAKVSLNTIKKANTQVPQLVMPPGLRKRGGFSLWNPDGYGKY